jgi:hypothetical protein
VQYTVVGPPHRKTGTRRSLGGRSDAQCPELRRNASQRVSEQLSIAIRGGKEMRLLRHQKQINRTQQASQRNALGPFAAGNSGSSLTHGQLAQLVQRCNAAICASENEVSPSGLRMHGIRSFYFRFHQCIFLRSMGPAEQCDEIIHVAILRLVRLF